MTLLMAEKTGYEILPRHLSTIHRKCRENAIGPEVLDVLMAKFQEDVELRYEVLGDVCALCRPLDD
jgi:hypothetical protein